MNQKEESGNRRVTHLVGIKTESQPPLTQKLSKVVFFLFALQLYSMTVLPVSATPDIPGDMVF